MNAALQTLKSFKNEGRKIAVLGDMRELGNSAADEHLDILKTAFKNTDYVYLAGDEFLKAFKNFESNGAGNVRAFKNKEEFLKIDCYTKKFTCSFKRQLHISCIVFVFNIALQIMHF